MIVRPLSLRVRDFCLPRFPCNSRCGLSGDTRGFRVTVRTLSSDMRITYIVPLRISNLQLREIMESFISPGFALVVSHTLLFLNFSYPYDLANRCN